jgi:hypothetical protein
MGLMLTSRSPQEVLKYFNKLQMEDYARAGNNVNKIGLHIFLLQLMKINFRS